MLSAQQFLLGGYVIILYWAQNYVFEGMDHQSTPSNSGDLNDVCSSGDENSDDEEDSISEGMCK